MQTREELNRPAPALRAFTASGVRELSDYRGKWLALIYCPRGSCAERPECLAGLRMQVRAVAALGGRLLMLHPKLAADDAAAESLLKESGAKSLEVGTVLEPEFLERYRVAADNDRGQGVAGVFLIDPQGKLRAAARYTACAPAVMHEIAVLMKAAIQRFGLSGTLESASAEVKRCEADANYGCVEWFHYG